MGGLTDLWVDDLERHAAFLVLEGMADRCLANLRSYVVRGSKPIRIDLSDDAINARCKQMMRRLRE